LRLRDQFRQAQSNQQTCSYPTSKGLAHARQHRLGVASCEALFIELADMRRDTSLPSVEYLNASQADLFGKGFAKSCLHRARHSQRVI
jgi:hypothetical protein